MVGPRLAVPPHLWETSLTRWTTRSTSLLVRRTPPRHLVRAALVAIGVSCAANPAGAAFTDATAAYGLVVPDGMSYSSGWMDFDGDGVQDLYIGNHFLGPSDLFRGLPGGGFVEDSEQFGTGNSDRHDQLWGDFDNDGAPDQYISHGAGYPGTQDKELFWNRGNSTFEEGAGAAGVTDEVGRGREITLADFDNDGWLDIFVTNDFRAGFPKPNRLFMNDHDGTFTQAPNVDALFVTRIHCAGADYDGDGDTDLAVSTPQFQNGELYRNQGNGTFVDATVSAFPGLSLPLKQAQGLSWADYDDDGDLDLLACGGNYPFWDFAALEGDSLRFYAACDPAETKSLRITTAADSVTFFGERSDFGALPCYFGSGGSSSTSYPFAASMSGIAGTPPAILTSADGIFLWSAHAGGGLDSLYVVIRAPLGETRDIGGHVKTVGAPISSWVKDSFDTPPPFTVADWRNRLYRNDGNGTFTEVTASAFAVNDPRTCASGAAWADYDNDGRLDVYIANSGTVETKNQPDQLYRNNGDGTFAEIGAAEGIQGPIAGMTDGGAWGDANDDGFLDLFVNNGAEHPPFGIGPRQLFVNAPNANHWIMLELQGIASNGSGIGARARFVGATGTRWRHHLGESDNGYAPFFGLHVGLGEDAICDSVQIFWPSGQVDTHLAVAADSRWFAIEGEPLRPLENPTLVLGVTALADTVSQDADIPLSIPLSNAGGAAVHWTATIEDCAGQPAPWMILDRMSGPLWPGSTPDLLLTIDPSPLALGAHCGRVVFNSNSIAGPDTVNIDILVVSPGATGAPVPGEFPSQFELARPSPNPARGGARTVLSLPRAADIEVSVYDLAGHRVRSLLAGRREAGFHSIVWDGRDERGRRTAPGAYFLRAVLGSETRTRKLILLD